MAKVQLHAAVCTRTCVLLAWEVQTARRHESLYVAPLSGLRINGIARRRIFYGLAAMGALLVLGTIIGLIWADTSDVAGAFAVVTNIVGAVGVVSLLIALAVVTRRQRQG